MAVMPFQRACWVGALWNNSVLIPASSVSQFSTWSCCAQTKRDSSAWKVQQHATRTAAAQIKLEKINFSCSQSRMSSPWCHINLASHQLTSRGAAGTARHPDGAPGGDGEPPPALRVSGGLHAAMSASSQLGHSPKKQWSRPLLYISHYKKSFYSHKLISLMKNLQPSFLNAFFFSSQILFAPV